MTARLPIPGGDDNDWGDILNQFLQVAHNNDGTLNPTAVADALPSPIPTANLGGGTASSSNFLRGDGTWSVPSGPSNATSSAPGLIQLSGDLGGSATAPTITKLQGTSVNAASPTNNQVLSYNSNSGAWVPSTVSSTTVNDATSSTPGIIQLDGDLGNTATSPEVVSTHLSSALPVNQGGTGSQTQNFVDLSSNQSPIAGNKTFTGTLSASNTILGNISGNAATATNASTVTTNANLAGDVTSVGNTTTLTSSSNVESIISNNSTVAGKASLASPALTGTPTAPTATAGTDSTQIATTAYADSAVNVEASRAETAEALLAPKTSPTFTGTPSAPTAIAGTDTTQIATTAFVATAVTSGAAQDATSSTPGLIQLDGDLGGSATSPTVESIQGVAISGTPTAGKALLATSTSAAAWSAIPGTTDWINVKSYGATGNGTTDDTTAIQAALSAANASGGGTVFMPVGTYLVSSSLSIPPYTFLVGETEITLNLFTSPTGISRIVAAASWNPSSSAGIVEIRSKTPGGWSVNTCSCGLTNIFIDGSQNISANLQGINLVGPVYDLHLQDVFIWKAPHDGITASGQTESGITPTYPYHQRWDRVTVANSGFTGINIVNSTDSVFVNSMAFACGGNGWNMQNNPNCLLLGCKSEWNTGRGYDITGSNGSVVLSGCETDQNYAEGIRIHSASADATDGGGIVFSGGKLHADGHGGTNTNGILITATTAPVTITGLNVELGQTSYPVIACSVNTSSNITLAGCTLQGSTAGWSDGGGNTFVNKTAVTEITGNIGSQAQAYSGIVSVSANYNVGASDELVLADAFSAAMTLTLPTAVGCAGKWRTLKKVDTSNNNVTVATTASQTIDGNSSWGLAAPNAEVTVQSDGSNWRVVNASGTYLNRQVINVATAGSALSILNTDATPTNPIVNILAWAAGVPSFAIGVNGDSSSRFASDSNGTLQWGPGSAARDVQLQRTAAGVLTLTPQNNVTASVFNASALSSSGLTGATAASRYVGATSGGAPTGGTFTVGDFTIDQTGTIWICTTAGSPGTWTQISAGSSGATLGVNTFTGNQTAPAFISSGLTGATAASRYVGATNSGSPTSGTFAVGDHTIDRSGAIWICTAAGTPGTWVEISGSSQQATWAPSDAGFLSWTFDSIANTTSSAPAAGSITLMRVNVRSGVSCTNVALDVGTAGSGLTTAENYAGLYSSAGTLIGATADQTTNWASSGTKVMSLSGGPYALSAGFYWVAVVANGTAPPSLMRAPSNSPHTANENLSATTARFATNGTGTTLPASITPSSNTLSTAPFWAAIG